MKNIVFILLLMPISVFAQSEISGIGYIKIGKLKSEILDSLYPVLGKPRDKSAIPYYCDDHRIYHLTKPKKNETNFHGRFSVCPGVDVYYISEMEISSIPIKNWNLYFYNDTLYSIENEGEVEFLKALKTKYGEGKVSNYAKTIKCRYDYSGSANERQEMTERTIWRDDRIFCSYSFSKFYSDKCEASFVFDFTIYNKNLYYLVSSIKSENEKEKNEKDNEDFKKRLDKF